MFKVKYGHYKPEMNRICDECGVEIGDYAYYRGMSRCVGCWVEYECNHLRIELPELISRVKEALINGNDSSVQLSREDTVLILQYLQEIESVGEEKVIDRQVKPSEHSFIVEKTFSEEINFQKGATHKYLEFERYNFNTNKLMAEGKIKLHNWDNGK